MLQKLRQRGPGAAVTAAFIGPGTVTACSLAGANFGYALLWVLLFATAATILLQEMASRLGVVTQQGLGETLRMLLRGSVWRWPLILLVGAALFMGNAAYEAGNLAGAALGVEAVLGGGGSISEGGIPQGAIPQGAVFQGAVGITALLAGGLLLLGQYRHIEKILLFLVMLMALAFFASFAIARPDLSAALRGLFRPSLPPGSLFVVIGLIGTTIVPYNLFLHATSASRKWASAEQLDDARTDTAQSIGLGGLVALLITATAAASLYGQGVSVTGARDMAQQFEPLFGAYARYILGVGFFAAGLTSAITAPLATGYAVTEVLGLSGKRRQAAFRAVALVVLLVGVALSLTGIRPITIILAAQFANGLLLPIIAGALLWVMNSDALLGPHVNGRTANTLGAGVLLITLGLGVNLMLEAVGMI